MPHIRPEALLLNACPSVPVVVAAAPCLRCSREVRQVLPRTKSLWSIDPSLVRVFLVHLIHLGELIVDAFLLHYQVDLQIGDISTTLGGCRRTPQLMSFTQRWLARNQISTVISSFCTVLWTVFGPVIDIAGQTNRSFARRMLYSVGREFVCLARDLSRPR